MQFPCLVYKSASEHFLINTEKEYSVALECGWFPTVPEALDALKNANKATPKAKKETPVVVEEVPQKVESVEGSVEVLPSREEIEEKASEMGLTFDKRTSYKKLLKMVSEPLVE